MANWTLDTVTFTATTPYGEKFLRDFEAKAEMLIEQSQDDFVLLTDILKSMGVELPVLEICNTFVRVNGVRYEGGTTIIYTRAPWTPPVVVMTLIAMLFQLKCRVVGGDYMTGSYIDTDSEDNAELIAKIESRIIEELQKSGISDIYESDYNQLEQWG